MGRITAMPRALGAAWLRKRHGARIWDFACDSERLTQQRRIRNRQSPYISTQRPTMGQVINRFLDELVDVLAKITEIFGG